MICRVPEEVQEAEAEASAAEVAVASAEAVSAAEVAAEVSEAVRAPEALEVRTIIIITTVPISVGVGVTDIITSEAADASVPLREQYSLQFSLCLC